MQEICRAMSPPDGVQTLVVVCVWTVGLALEEVISFSIGGAQSQG